MIIIWWRGGRTRQREKYISTTSPIKTASTLSLLYLHVTVTNSDTRKQDKVVVRASHRQSHFVFHAYFLWQTKLKEAPVCPPVVIFVRPGLCLLGTLNSEERGGEREREREREREKVRKKGNSLSPLNRVREIRAVSSFGAWICALHAERNHEHVGTLERSWERLFFKIKL